MHDQRKVREEVDEKTRERRLADVQSFTSRYNSLLAQRDGRVYTEAVLRRLGEVLQANPEAYSMYNYRRNVLMHLWKETNRRGRHECTETTEGVKESTQTTTTTVSGGGGDGKREGSARSEMDWLKDELKLSSAIILKDYKVYAAFVHRRWIFAQLKRLAEESISNAAVQTEAAVEGIHNNNNNNEKNAAVECPEEVRFWSLMLLKEKKQCDALLAADERNFHAWNYRRWILNEFTQLEKLLAQHGICLDSSSTCTAAGDKKEKEEEEMSARLDDGGDNDAKKCTLLFTPDEVKELNFTTAMVGRNFSNYSAWHQRGLIINAALQRLEEKEKQKENTRTIVLGEAWQQLEKDLELFTTAIYCDPADQSAWYYAQFLRRAAETLKNISGSHHKTYMNILVQPIHACIELLKEEKHLGDDAEIYWPRYYLFTTLLSSAFAGKSLNTDEESTKRRKSEIVYLACEIRRELYPCGDISNETSSVEDDRVFCLRELAAELIRADPLRRGMYKDLLETATR